MTAYASQLWLDHEGNPVAEVRRPREGGLAITVATTPEQTAAWKADIAQGRVPGTTKSAEAPSPSAVPVC